jgi:uncharacterized protein (TIGR02001 family)
MNKSLLSLAVALCVTAIPAVAQAQAASPLTFNASLTTDYRYRGISQSRLGAAVQGGLDYAAPSGFYVGAWASSIQWIKDGGGDAPLEIDLYGGWKGEVAKGLTLDVGALSYQYPNNKLAVKAETLELYGALSYGPATLKYSHSVSNLFGFADSKGSGYLDLSATFDVGGGVMVTPHVGHQKVANLDAASYTDYSVTVSKDFDGWVPSVALVGTDTEVYVSPAGKNLGKTALVLAIKKNF